jgi:hypothetical protein
MRSKYSSTRSSRRTIDFAQVRVGICGCRSCRIMRSPPAIARTNPETCSSVPGGRPGTGNWRTPPAVQSAANNLQTVEPVFLPEVELVALAMGTDGPGHGFDGDSGVGCARTERLQWAFRIDLLPPSVAVQPERRLSGCQAPARQYAQC